ncbi:MAG: hypothetical protein AB8F94_10475 [Saprospiraceae bacterium]
MQTKTTTALLLQFFLFYNFTLGQFYYSPNDGGMSILKEKNDFHFSTSFQSSIFSKAPENFQVELGISPRQFLSIQSNFFHQKYNSKIVGFNAFDGKYYAWSIAVGLYYFFPQTHVFDYKKKRIHQRKPLFSKKSKWIEKEGLLADFHLGYGEGRSNVYFRPPVFHQLSFQRFYAQLGVHWFGKIIGFSYTYRIGFINYHKLQGTFIGLIGRNNLSFYDGLIAQPLTFHESSVRILLGVKQIKYFINLSRMNTSMNFQLTNFNNYNFNMGMMLSLNDFLGKKKKKRRSKGKKKRKK